MSSFLHFGRFGFPNTLQSVLSLYQKMSDYTVLFLVILTKQFSFGEQTVKRLNNIQRKHLIHPSLVEGMQN